VGAIDDSDSATVEALLRLALTARRVGGQLRLVNATGQLRDLLTCTGLAEILGGNRPPDKPGREAERGEQ